MSCHSSCPWPHRALLASVAAGASVVYLGLLPPPSFPAWRVAPYVVRPSPHASGDLNALPRTVTCCALRYASSARVCTLATACAGTVRNDIPGSSHRILRHDGGCLTDYLQSRPPRGSLSVRSAAAQKSPMDENSNCYRWGQPVRLSSVALM
jgi:hypothetical protein